MENLAENNAQYTPSGLARIYAQTVAQDIRGKMVPIRGIYSDKSKYSKRSGRDAICYGGFYYDVLVDEKTGDELTLKIPKNLKSRIIDGNVYAFRGNIENKLKKGRDIALSFLFVPDQILSEATFQDTTRHQNEVKVYEKKRARTEYDVDRALRQFFHNGKRPRISMLYGNNGIVDADVKSALRGVENAYLLIDTRVSFANEDEIIRAIKKAEVRSDIVAIVRGGGSGLEVFDSFDLANMVLDTRIPVIAAIGHDEDDTLVKQIADKAFSTPTAFGNYLREMALGIEGDRKIEEEVNNNILNQSNWGLVCGIAVTAIIFFLLFWKN